MRLRAAFGIGIADQAQHVGDVRAVGQPQRFILHAEGEVVAAMRHAEAGLRDPDGVGVWIGGAGGDADADGRVVADDAHETDEFLVRLHGPDAGEVGLQRVDPARLDRRLVHSGGVEISDLPFERAGGGLRRDDGPRSSRGHRRRTSRIRSSATPTDTLSGGSLVGREPFAVDVAVEVLARARLSPSEGSLERSFWPAGGSGPLLALVLQQLVEDGGWRALLAAQRLGQAQAMYRRRRSAEI